MARRPPLPQALADLIAQLEPALAQAFLDAMANLRDGIDFKALQAALERGDIEAALRALNIEAGAFGKYVAERTSAFSEAGALSAAYIPARDAESINFRFDLTNPRAERMIREEAATRVAGYTAEQIETARTVIVDGYAKGQGPQQIAVDIAGRVDRVTGRRTGGIIGLSEPQAGYVKSMRERLASGDPAEMKKVLGEFGKDGKWKAGTGMTLRDRRYDGLVKRAIAQAVAEKKHAAAVAQAEAAGLPPPPAPRKKKDASLTQADIDKLSGLYADRLLKRRAEDVAVTETAQGVMTARMESYAQALEKEGLPPEAVTKKWRHLGGVKDAREQHLAMAGKSVAGLNTAFVMPDGTQMQHSHDPKGGGKHNINCHCSTDFHIDFLWGFS